jgi:hypothetical protein
MDSSTFVILLCYPNEVREKAACRLCRICVRVTGPGLPFRRRAARPRFPQQPGAAGRISGASFPVLLECRFSRTLKGMDVHLTNPDLEAKLDRWVAETGRRPDELVEDAMAGYFDELARTREMLNSRYDDLKSGRVKPISRDELVAHFREKSGARRTSRP